MPKYYVAGIPFDSEDCLKHYGVPNMEWGKHKYGPDADTRYINWMKDIGKFANNAAKTVSNAATSAARAVGGALNKSANFVTGNQERQNLNNAKANVANVQSGRSKVNDAYARYDQLRNSEAQHRTAANGWRESQANRAPLENFGRNQDRINADNEDRRANRDANRAEIAKMKADRMAERQRNAETQARAEAKNAQQAYNRTLPGAAENAARGAQGFLNSAGKWVSTAAGNAAKGVSDAANQAGQWVGDRAKDVGNFVSNKDEEQRMYELAKSYDPNTGKWRSEADRKAFYEAQNAYNNHPLTAIPNIARQIGTDISDGPVGDFARSIGNMANQIGSDVSNYVDYNITGAGQNRDADMYEDWIRQNREKRGEGQPAYQVDREAELSRAANEAREDAQNNTLFGRISNAANAVGNWVGDRAKDVGNVATDAWNGVTNAANQAGQWIGDRANDVGKAAGSAVNAVGNAANDAGQWIGDRAREAGETIGNAANGAREWAGNAAKDVRDFVSEMENPHIQIDAEKVKENYRNYLNEHPENPQSPKHEEWLKEQIREDPELRRYYEQNVKNQIIPEQRITEYGPRSTPRDPRLTDAQQKQVDYWDGVIQKRIDDFDNYYNNLISYPRWQNYTRQDVMDDLLRQQDYWRNLAYRENLQHSEFDNRPEGVGEEFWKNYVAHGGTREDYEREWR